MKQCANPDCTSYQEGRTFPDRDIICPRCGEPLLISEAQVDPNLYRGANPYGTPGIQLPRHADSIFALLGALATLGLIALLIYALYLMGAIGPGVPGAAGAATPAGLGVAPAVQTERAIAQATRTARPTPIGGLLGGGGPLDVTPEAVVTPIVDLPTPVSQPTIPPGGTTAGNPPSATARTMLCQRLDAGQPCNQVGSYGTLDPFYLAVESTFGPNAARTARVQWYGPPNGETLLVNEPQMITPNRDGRFWVGFSLTQSQPWQPGVYRADVFLDDSTQRATYATWTVTP